MPAIADQSLPLNATTRQIASVLAIEARIAPIEPLSSLLTGTNPSTSAPPMIVATITASTERRPSSDQYTSSR